MIVLLIFLLLFCDSLALDKPNIVLIVADDLGWNDVSIHGSEIPTPNLDSLGYNGVVLNRHYSEKMCSASRTALMTSKFPSRLGMSGMPPIIAGSDKALPLHEKLFPQYFKDLGYSTHLVGKWHLGNMKTEYTPTKRGFDSFFGYYNGYIGHYDGIHIGVLGASQLRGLDFRQNLKGSWDKVVGKYITDVLTNEAEKVIKDHSGKTGSKNGILLVICHSAPHSGNPGVSSLLPTPNGLDPAIRNLIPDPKRRMLADMVKELDDSIGKIVSALNSTGLLNNTIIGFFSDNGAPTEDLITLYNRGSNWPLRGQKYSGHEGGTRTTGLLWSPNLVRPGRVYNGLFHMVDWFPTLYSAAGGDVSKLPVSLDGEDQWEEIVSGSGEEVRDHLLTNLDSRGSAIIQNNWKLISDYQKNYNLSFSDGYLGASGRGILCYNWTLVNSCPVALILSSADGPSFSEIRDEISLDTLCSERINASHPIEHNCYSKPCLFDLSVDPCEYNDVSSQHPEVVVKLSQLLQGYKKRMVKESPVTADLKSNPKCWSNYWTPWLDGNYKKRNCLLQQ